MKNKKNHKKDIRKKRELRVLITGDTFDYEHGGVTFYTIDLVNFLINKGIKVKVISFGDKKQIIKQKNLEIIKIPGINIIKSIKGKCGLPILKLIKEIKKFSPDIIHNHSQYTMGITTIISWLIANKLYENNIKLINHYHMFAEGILPHMPKLIPQRINKFFVDMLTKFYINTCTIVLTPSEYTKQYLIKKYNINRKKIDFVYYGIEKTRIKEKTKEKVKNKVKDTIKICFAGRISNEKRPEMVIKTFYKLINELKKDQKKTNEIKKIVLNIYGDGPLLNKIKDISSKLNTKIKNEVNKSKLEYKINFHGWIAREKLIDMLSKNDIFLTFSNTETFGITVLEAMASGLAIIATNTGALPELISHNNNGFLIQEQKSEKKMMYKNETKLEEMRETILIDEAVKYILTLINNRKKLEDMKLKSIEKAREMEKEKSFSKVIRIYENLVVGNRNIS